MGEVLEGWLGGGGKRINKDGLCMSFDVVRLFCVAMTICNVVALTINFV